MSDGRLTRLVILSVLLLSPLAAAAPPAPRHSTADGTDGQDVVDLALDATGQFGAAVVAYDAARLNLGGVSPDHDDVYLCDYGSVSQPTAGGNCRGIDHASAVRQSTQAPNAPQRVDATRDAAGQGVYAVAGPGAFISAWRSTANTPTWTLQTGDQVPATNVTLSHDGSRVVFGTTPSSPTSPGRIEVREMSDGDLDWALTLTTADAGNLRPTSLDLARSGGVLAIGTTDGLLVTDATTTSAPTGTLGGITQVERVSRVLLSADGKYVVVGASNGVFLGTVSREGGKLDILPATVFNRGFSAEVQDVAFTLDGSRFAAASGNSIHFYRRLDTSQLAEPLGSQQLPTTVSSIAYDQRGQLLVAVAGTMVYGFGPNKLTPMWSFDASQTAFGALDGPLRKVAVSDDAQRVVVAGKTKTMAYNSILGVTATLASTNATTTLTPTQTLNLTLTVKNTGSLTDNYSFSVITPIGWQTASAESVRLDPNETGTVRFDVTAPSGGEPGVYGVQVRVRSALAEERNPQVGYVAGPAFNITIPRSVVLKVEAPDDRLLLRQGGEQTISVTLRNEGNARGLVNLSARQELTRGASWDIRFVPEQVEVPAAGTASVSMIVTAPSDAGSGDRNIITLRAREGETVEATDTITAYVDAQFGAELKTNLTAWEFYPGQVQTLRLNVSNIGNTEDTYNLTYSITPANVESDWRVTIESPQVTIARGQTKQVGVTVKAVASDAREAALTLRSISQSSPDREENTLVLSLVTIPRPPTEEKKDSLIPAVPPVLVVLVVALLAVARVGGRR